MVSGLSFKIYDGYFGDPTQPTGGDGSLDNLYYDTGRTPINSGSGITNFANISTATNQILAVNGRDNYTVVWNGFFLANITGSWTFGLASDDGSYMWIGTNAFYGYTISNANINNHGLHDVVDVPCSVFLESGKYYRIRILFGELTIGDNCKFYYSTDGGTTKNYDFSGNFFT